MKVIMLCITRVVVGKMAEYMELEKKMFEICERIGGMLPWRKLSLVSGKGDMQHTIVYLFEFDNFAAMDKWVKMMEDPDMAAMMPKFDSLIGSHEHDVYMEMPKPSGQS